MLLQPLSLKLISKVALRLQRSTGLGNETSKLFDQSRHFMLLKKILSQIKGTLEMYRKEGGESLTMVLNSFDKPNFTVIRMLL